MELFEGIIRDFMSMHVRNLRMIHVLSTFFRCYNGCNIYCQGDDMILMKKIVIVAFFLSSLFFVEQAEVSSFDHHEALSIVEKGFEAQVLLSKNPLPQDEIKEILNEYFTVSFTEAFIKENVHEVEENLYQTLGSDFASYYIPFFKYSDETNMGFLNEECYIWEEMNYRDLPFYSENNIEAVVLVKENGVWKVNEITYDIPEELLVNS